MPNFFFSNIKPTFVQEKTINEGFVLITKAFVFINASFIFIIASFDYKNGTCVFTIKACNYSLYPIKDKFA